MTTVTQEDREAAAKMQRWRNHDKTSGAEAAMLDGLLDDNHTVQAFASHREQSVADLLEALIAMRDLKNGTEMTYEDAYDSMFKSGGRDAWQMLEAAITKVTQS